MEWKRLRSSGANAQASCWTSTMLLDKVSGFIQMTERTVTIRLGIQDEIGNRLLEIWNSLLSKSIVSLRVNGDGIDQARKASAQVRAELAAAVKDLGALGGAINFKAWLNTRTC